MADKPKVFVSSTIYDFRDLRSALKFWLEELGFEVLLSEHNDFPVQADLNSYETCLKTIDDCDYLIILVGGRVGGWYDKDKRISITQAEYQRGYEQLTEGRIKVIAFVRQDIWDVREDRNELERLLKNEALLSAELDETDIDKIAKHPSKFANDAKFTFGFLNEIAKIEEMKTALEAKSAFPIGNWIRRFRDFRDIVDALRVEFRIGNSLRRVALLTNLCAEIEANLTVLADQNNGNAQPKHEWASYARGELSGGIDAASDIKGKYLRWVAMFALTGCGVGRKLSTNALDESITSGEFLEFDQTADAFVVGPLHQALLDLKRNIERLRHNEELLSVESRMRLAEEFKHFDGETPETVPNLRLVPIFAIHDSQFNVMSLQKAIHRAANGDTSVLDNLQLYADSPLASENTTMQKERPTPEQIEHWLDS